MTNGEKIRQMTDEELSRTLGCECCIFDSEDRNCICCEEGILKWLQSEVEQ